MKQVLGLVMLAAIGISCSDDEYNGVGTKDEARVGVEMRATTSESRIAGTTRTQETGLVFHEVLLGVTELEFESDDDDNGYDDEIEFEGRYRVDLIRGTSTPDFGLASIDPDVYDEIEMEVAGVLEDGSSVFIVFDRPDGTRVEYSSRESFDIEIEREGGFRLDDSKRNHVLILFHLDKLLSAVDLTHASADDDGVIRINAGSNASIAKQVKGNIYRAFDAGDDDDDDDRFDDDDDDDDDRDDRDDDDDDDDR